MMSREQVEVSRKLNGKLSVEMNKLQEVDFNDSKEISYRCGRVDMLLALLQELYEEVE